MTTLSKHMRHAISAAGLLSVLLAVPASAASETVLFSFGKGTDGKFPEAGLIAVGGTLYGTTHCDGDNRAGTLFKLTPSGGHWTYKLLYTFTGGNDGLFSISNLIMKNGKLYGTTIGGGANGAGVIYSFKP